MLLQRRRPIPLQIDKVLEAEEDRLGAQFARLQNKRRPDEAVGHLARTFSGRRRFESSAFPRRRAADVVNNAPRFAKVVMALVDVPRCAPSWSAVAAGAASS